MISDPRASLRLLSCCSGGSSPGGGAAEAAADSHGQFTAHWSAEANQASAGAEQ